MLLFYGINSSKLKCFIDMVAEFFYKHIDRYC